MKLQPAAATESALMANPSLKETSYDWGLYEDNLMRAQLKSLEAELTVVHELSQRAIKLIESYETIYPKLETKGQVFTDFRNHLKACKERIISMHTNEANAAPLPEFSFSNRSDIESKLLGLCHEKAAANQAYFGIIDIYWSIHTSIVIVLENVARTCRELNTIIVPLITSIRASGLDAPRLFSMVGCRQVSFATKTAQDRDRVEATKVWKTFLQENIKSKYIQELTQHNGVEGRKRLVFFCIGGMGDALLQTPIVAELRRRFQPCEILFIHSRPVVVSIFSGNDSVDAALFARDELLIQLIPAVKLLDIFDLVFESRFLIWAELCANSRINNQEDLAWISRTQEYAVPYLSYLGRFPHYSNLFGRIFRPKMLLDIHGVSTGLNVSVASPLHIYPRYEDASYLSDSDLSAIQYVTVHDGFDESFGKQMGIDRCTKQLPMETWRTVVRGLKSRGFKVLQVGAKNEPTIPEIDFDLRGKTTISQLAHVLKGAVMHVDTEGGIVHVARAVHKRSLVFFGPTSVTFWGYPTNINITSREYVDSWWINSDWMARSPIRQKQSAMDAIDANKVADLVWSAEQSERNIKYSVSFTSELSNVGCSSINDSLKQALIRIGVSKDFLLAGNNGNNLPATNAHHYLKVGELAQSVHTTANKSNIYYIASCLTPIVSILHSLETNVEVAYAYEQRESTDYIHTPCFSDCKSHGIRETSVSPYNLTANTSEYDLVVCPDAFSWSRGDQRPIKEMLRLLKPAGMLIIGITHGFLFRQQGDMPECSASPGSATDWNPFNMLDILGPDIHPQDLSSIRDSLNAVKAIATDLSGTSRQIYGTLVIRRIG